MTATIAPTAPSTTANGRIRSFLATAPVWAVAAVSALVAAVAVGLTALVADLAGVPLEAAPQNADGPEAIPLWGFPMSMLMSGAVGVLIALAVARWSRKPARTWTIATVVLTVVSVAGPITTGHATTATRLVLELTHVVAAAIVIPALTWRLAQGPARGER
jgi:hypothetical protein